MVLLVKQVFGPLGRQHLVGALAEVGKALGEKIRPHSLVHGVPGFPAVAGPEHAHRRYAHPHPACLVAINHYAMQTEPAQSQLAAVPGDVAAQRRDLIPGAAVIQAFETGRRLSPRV